MHGAHNACKLEAHRYLFDHGAASADRKKRTLGKHLMYMACEKYHIEKYCGGRWSKRKKPLFSAVAPGTAGVCLLVPSGHSYYRRTGAGR